MAGLVELHSDYFSRKFKKETGFPFHGYVLQCRINLSIYLLRETDKKIKEIFREVGFNQPEIFSRNFKRVVGCSPRLFRMLESPIQEGLHEKVFARVFSELGDFQ